MSGEEMQNKIATARRDAEGLKDKIKRRKDELADTHREYPFGLIIRVSGMDLGACVFLLQGNDMC